MPEFRTDWLTGRTVIIAENRAGRPNEFTPAEGQGNRSNSPEHGGQSAAFDCPFCPGRESETPPSVYEQRDGNGLWRLRVVPNKYPALTLGPIPPLPLGEGRGEGMRTDPNVPTPAVGAHEVVIESARHIESVTELSVPELDEVLQAYVQRLSHWRADGRFRYGLVFKNVGGPAGASLSHVHSQLVALPDVPHAAEREVLRAAEDFQSRQACPYCRWIDRECTSGQRIVLDRDGYVAFCPYASLQPGEVWLLPTHHEPWFERSDSLDRLADVLDALLNRVEAVVPGSSYNLLVRTAPWHDTMADWCHWRIEILPRVASIAGLELATGVHINPVAPERAAREMR